MSIAFFDLDKTILARNSAALWVRSEWRLGYVRTRDALRAYGWLLAYHLGFARLEDAVLESIATLTGTIEREVLERTLAFYEREVRHLVRPGAQEALERHRRAGDQLVLLTSSSNYLSEAFVRQLGMDDFISNRFEVDPGGCYTGRPLGTLCYGPGKVVLAREFAAARQVELKACSYYSDSSSDLPMLEAVGIPVAVNPDPQLRRLARKRGWSVVDWGEPRVSGSVRAAS